MKFAALTFILLSFAGLVGAQVTGSPDQARITADSVEIVGAVVQLRGNVQIRRGGALLLADEADVMANADVSAAPGGIVLRGNVRMTSEADIPLTIRKRQ